MGVKLLLQMMLVMLLLFIKEASAQIRSVALDGCQERCGDLVVPYPLGIGEKCSAYKTMEINCDNSSNPPKPFLKHSNVEVLNITVKKGTIHINYPITTDCTKRRNGPAVELSDPFTFSNTENRFTSMGCSNHALILYNSSDLKSVLGGCISMCAWDANPKKSCSGVNCCQTKFQPSLQHLAPRFMNREPRCDNKGPRYAFIVDQKWFGELEDIHSVKTMEYVPAVLNWRTNGKSCQSFGEIDPNINSNVCGRNASCTKQGLCSCEKGYDGNPYLQDGCQDIDECATAKASCEQICTNTPGSYTCSCNHGWVLVDDFKCRKKEVDHSGKKEAIITIATCAGLAVLLATTWLLYIVIRHEEKKKNFKKNGGPLFLEKVSPSQGPQGNVEKDKLFTSRMLEKITYQYDKKRILGEGGQGIVYKGMLADGTSVAVKKFTIDDDDESKTKDFINEVYILSEMDHKNIVKLHGCCLETKVPLLVYEFIPNGTLMHYIHEHDERFPLTWDVRVRVATEVAEALYYLHSSRYIIHRDIKSRNILLDNNYKAKLADFGTSRSISIHDQTHPTTRAAQGTSGYLDPEYLKYKSDVYSFGVVLVELFTGKKPIISTIDEARRLSEMEGNRILDILDPRITKEDREGREKEMIAFANIACKCLNLDEGKRPTMKEVVTELESIKRD